MAAAAVSFAQLLLEKDVDKGRRFRTKDYDIHINRVTEHVEHVVETSPKVLLGHSTTPDKENPHYLADYQYEFPNRAQVYIKGLGTVPAKGNFVYLMRETQLRFFDRDGGAPLAVIPLLRNAVDPHADSAQVKIALTEGHRYDEIPNVGSFPAAFRAYAWESPSSLPMRANTVLNKHQFLYQPYDYNGVTYLPTTSARVPVDGLHVGSFATVALLISFPYDRITEKYLFHIQSLVREDRTHSQDPRVTKNPVIIEAANSYVDKLVDEMKMGTLSKP